MRTLWPAFALMVVAAFGACQAFEPAGLPADVQRLGDIRLATPQEAAGSISQAEAVTAADADGYGRPGYDAYLVVHGGALRWLLRWDDVNFDKPAPPGADGSQRSVAPLDYLYVLIDARTGRVINATYME